MSQTQTATATYTVADIERVCLYAKADLMMIGDSTGAWTPEKARNYAYDVDVLARDGYLQHVDITLFSNGVEIKATRLNVDTDAGTLASSRPGGVLWPKVSNPYLRIILRYTDAYDAAARAATKGKLKIDWTPTDEDTSHATLSSSGGRNYVSNGYGMRRTDWAT